MECWPWLWSFSLYCGTYLRLFGLDWNVIVRDMVIRQHLKQSKLLWQWNGLLLRLSRTLMKKLLLSVMVAIWGVYPIPSQRSSQYSFLYNLIFHVLSHHVSQINSFLNHVPFRSFEKISIFMHVCVVACIILVSLREWNSLLLRDNLRKSGDIIRYPLLRNCRVLANDRLGIYIGRWGRNIRVDAGPSHRGVIESWLSRTQCF